MAAASADGKAATANGAAAPAAAATGPVPPGPSKDAPTLSVIDYAKALDQCCDDAGFLAELLADVLNESEQKLTTIKNALKSNDHKLYSETAHAVKGAALNLHLEGLGMASKSTEMLGKFLLVNPNDSTKLADRGGWVGRMEAEYARLREYVVANKITPPPKEADG